MARRPMVEYALELAQVGFYIFPLKPNSKKPVSFMTEFWDKASRDPEQIKTWWTMNPLFNIGITMNRFGSGSHLMGVDLDFRKGARETILSFELQEKLFPKTFEQQTTSGGWHLIYLVKHPVKNSVEKIGKGIDIRGQNGYLVGYGSVVDGKQYEGHPKVYPVEAPDWLVEAVDRACEHKNPVPKKVPENLDQKRAIERAQNYLLHEAEHSIEGQGGDITAYKVAARLKDFGVTGEKALILMDRFWNPGCRPPWGLIELKQKVEHAYRYGTEPIGSDAPEVQFDIVEDENLHPFEKLNKQFAFVTVGGKAQILWERKSPRGEFTLDFLSPSAFQEKLAYQTIQYNGKTRPLAKSWLQSPERRSYDALCFLPGLKTPPQFYNLWRGFRVEPAPSPITEMDPSVKAFLDHAFENVCNGDETLFKWLIGFFAHMIQKPYEKPLVALVFRGEKGVGKSALIERVGWLLGPHYLASAHKRYLGSNFTGHLEKCLLFVSDETYAGGDKHIDRILRDLITASTISIERKGQEPYPVENFSRIVIIGNDDKLVDASYDERRFAVFHVGTGKKQDREFFYKMRKGLEEGGYPHLLRYLMDYDISDLDVNAAPKTKALLEQKLLSLPSFPSFWFSSLKDARIPHSDFASANWPSLVETKSLRDAYARFHKEHFMDRMNPLNDVHIGRHLKRYGITKVRNKVGVMEYTIPSLETCRSLWEKEMGHEVNWEE